MIQLSAFIIVFCCIIATIPTVYGAFLTQTNSSIPCFKTSGGFRITWQAFGTLNGMVVAAGGQFKPAGSQSQVNTVCYSVDYGYTWNSYTGPFSARYGSYLVQFGEALMLLGGGDWLGNWKDDVWQSTDGKSWSLLSSSLTPSTVLRRSNAGMVSIKMASGAKVCIFGGINWSATPSPVLYNSIYCSQNLITWSQVITEGPIWSPRFSSAYALVNNGFNVVIYGGSTSSSGTWTKDVWLGSADMTTWRLLNNNPPFGIREIASLVGTGRYVYFLGGCSSGTCPNDVWITTDFGATWMLVTNDGGFVGREEALAAAAGYSLIFAGGWIGHSWTGAQIDSLLSYPA